MDGNHPARSSRWDDLPVRASLYWMAEEDRRQFPLGQAGPKLAGIFRNLPKRERRMSKPHPSMALTLDLDEAIVDHELRLRSTAATLYLGTPVVRTHPAGDGEPVNTSA